MKHPSDYSNEQVVILGLAKSGQAVARVFHELGAIVTVNDRKSREDCPEAEELEALGIQVICGEHPESLIHPDVKLVVKNPGIPYHVPPIMKAIEFGIDIVTEIEVGSYLCAGPIIGVTGSNGKTTTTTWVGLILEKAGLKPIVAGNIGRPLCDAAKENIAGQWLVVELSSFQLKGTQLFRPHIACLLNIYETHLDYHGNMDDYIESKAKLFANQTAEDIAVVNWDDSECRRLSSQSRATLFPFSAIEKLPYGIYVQEGMITYRDKSGETWPIIPPSELGIAGKHNLENALATAAVAIAANVDIHVIAPVLREFRGVEHRQEFVRTLGDIRFYNDSKATNSSASMKAMDAFEAPIIWIGGGLDRGSDYMELLPYFESRVKAVVLIGETKFKLQRVAEQARLRSIEVVDTANSVEDMMNQAVKLAYAAAERGDVILFSPACASWDMFTSYEQRGRMFKASVHNL
ncbi:MAG: UDP-N-acetylmuramoyl-L-alanine--D-glutamate ligase [Paenibacillaceae bacterium]